MHNLYRAHIAVFIGTLTLVGLTLVTGQRASFSEREKRTLHPLPRLSRESILSGLYMDSLDRFIADHFPQREWLLSVADSLRSFRGIQRQGARVYVNLEAIDELAQDTEDLQESAGDEADSAKIFKDKEQARNSKGLVVSKGQGIHVFTNEASLAKSFAEAVDSYADKFKIRTFCVVTPTAGAFKMPKEYAAYAKKESDNIREIYTHLKKAIPVDVYTELEQHQKEYIFYRTDHHWTDLGAYYGYVAFCKAAGFAPIDIRTLPRKMVAAQFLGTYFLKTNDASLKANPDTVFYRIPPVQPTAQSIEAKQIKQVPVFQDSTGRNQYLVFLGGDLPLMKLTSASVKNGSNVLVIKNSYGNPFVTYLTANYQQALVLDYRYFKGNLAEIIQTYKISDIIFVSSVFAANEPSHIKKIKRILKKAKQ